MSYSFQLFSICFLSSWERRRRGRKKGEEGERGQEGGEGEERRGDSQLKQYVTVPPHVLVFTCVDLGGGRQLIRRERITHVKLTGPLSG